MSYPVPAPSSITSIGRLEQVLLATTSGESLDFKRKSTQKSAASHTFVHGSKAFLSLDCSWEGGRSWRCRGEGVGDMCLVAISFLDKNNFCNLSLAKGAP